MSDPKNSTTTKVLRTHERVVSWGWRLADLLLVVLMTGGFCIWHMGQYLGNFAHLPRMM